MNDTILVLGFIAVCFVIFLVYKIFMIDIKKSFSQNDDKDVEGLTQITYFIEPNESDVGVVKRYEPLKNIEGIVKLTYFSSVFKKDKDIEIKDKDIIELGYDKSSGRRIITKKTQQLEINLEKYVTQMQTEIEYLKRLNDHYVKINELLVGKDSADLNIIQELMYKIANRQPTKRSENIVQPPGGGMKNFMGPGGGLR